MEMPNDISNLGMTGPKYLVTESRRRIRTILYTVAAVLSVIGLADATYLTIEYLLGENAGCVVAAGCFEVLGSTYATFGKVPLAALGALAYFTAFSLATLAAFGHRRVEIFLMLLVEAMFAVTLWLLLVQAFVLHAFCDYCLLSAAITFSITGVVVASYVFLRKDSRLSDPKIRNNID
jgi:uncharacterized membrane protein